MHTLQKKTLKYRYTTNKQVGTYIIRCLTFRPLLILLYLTSDINMKFSLEHFRGISGLSRFTLPYLRDDDGVSDDEIYDNNSKDHDE